MGVNYNSLSELKKKKELLKQEVKEKEKLLRFDNIKESLSYMTHGASDKFLVEKPVKNEDGVMTTKTGISLNANAVKESVVENALRLGAVTLVGNYAKKNLYSSNWKKKFIGLAMIYVLPMAISKGIELLEEYQQKKNAEADSAAMKDTMI